MQSSTRPPTAAWAGLAAGSSRGAVQKKATSACLEAQSRIDGLTGSSNGVDGNGGGGGGQPTVAPAEILQRTRPRSEPSRPRLDRASAARAGSLPGAGFCSVRGRPTPRLLDPERTEAKRAAAHGAQGGRPSAICSGQKGCRRTLADDVDRRECRVISADSSRPYRNPPPRASAELREGGQTGEIRRSCGHSGAVLQLSGPTSGGGREGGPSGECLARRASRAN